MRAERAAAPLASMPAARRALAAILLALAACDASSKDAAPDTPPKPLERVQPVYPHTLLQQGVGGLVVVQVQIDAEGNVAAVSVRQSPHELLTDAVEAAIKRWKFQPATKDGRAVPSRGRYEFAFNILEGDAKPGEYLSTPPDVDTVAKYVASLDGAEAFRTEYWRARGHKAFAAAHDGGWGWASARSSPEQATQGALENCDASRTSMSRPCRIVDIDGQWQKSAERTATPLHHLSPFEIAHHPREKVEAWSDQKKARAMPVLDRCRSEADRYVQLLKSSDVEALYSSAAQALRDQHPRAEFERSLGAIRQLFGAVKQVTFRSQNLVTRWGDDELRLDLHSLVVYTAVTTTMPEILLIVTLSPEAGTCRATGFFYWSPSAGPPPWLPRESGADAQRGT